MSAEFAVCVGFGFIHKPTPESLKAIRQARGMQDDFDDMHEALEDLIDAERYSNSDSHIALRMYEEKNEDDQTELYLMVMDKNSMREIEYPDNQISFSPNYLSTARPSELMALNEVVHEELAWVFFSSVFDA